MSQHVVVVGGGVVGLSTAWYLALAGHRVTVVDTSPAGDGCSYGNMGYVAPSHIVTLSAPGVVKKGLRWMLDPESPFYLKPRLDLGLLRWAWLFYSSATEAHVERSIPPLRDLSLLSRRLYGELRDAGLGFELEEKGLIMAYRTPKGREDEEQTGRRALGAGLEVEFLDADEVRAREPGIELDVTGGVFYPQDAHVRPPQLMAALQRALGERGVDLRWSTRVSGFATRGRRVVGVESPQGTIDCDEVVVAAGSWSGKVARQLGLRLPLQPGKGYSFTLREVPRQIEIPMILAETKVALTPMGPDLHIGGTMELSGFGSPTLPGRVRGIVRAVETYLPGLPIEQPERVWSGLRPVSPDGLPYIGRSAKWANVTIAAGHAMLGMSLGPGTGALVADLIDGRPSSVGLEPFSPDRFA